MATKEEVKNLRALSILAKKYANNDLFNFWMEKKHRLIHKVVHYFPIYETWFSKFRNTDVVFVEIGVQNGGSAQMWKDYFGKYAKIIGVDIDERCKQFEDEQITIEIGSQEDPKFWAEFKQKYPRVDVLLDDGGHTMKQQITSFNEMFPHVSEGGIYMCEDCGTSYRKDRDTWGGGYGNPNTFIEYTKKLIDLMNAYETKGIIEPDYFTHNIGGIHFYDAIVVFEKSYVPFAPFDCQIGEWLLK